MRTSSAIALFLAVTVAVGGFLLFTPSTTAQDDEGDDDVPIPFTPSQIGSVNLYFWEEDYGESGQCEVQPEEEEGPTSSYTPFCSARLDVPEHGETSQQQERNVVQEDPVGEDDDVPEDHMVRFVMDTEPQMAQADSETIGSPDHDVEDAIRGEGAEFPFTIRAANNAIVYDFWYNANEPCSSLTGTPLDFTMQIRRAQSATEPLEGADEGNVIERTVATERSCGHSGAMSRTGAERVTAAVDLDNPIHVATGETLIVEIYAETSTTTPDLDWAIFYQGDDSDSQLQDSSIRLKTNQVVEKALWAADSPGSLTSVSAFDPNAPEDERLMVGHVALRSPFGAGALDSNERIEASIENPEGTLMNLHPDHEERQQFSVAYSPIAGLTSHNGSQTVYRFAEIDETQPWAYDPDQENFQEGPHTITASGTLVGDQARSIDAGTTVGMGDFGFTLEPIEGESTLHQMVPDSSSTFLLELTNQAPSSEVFELDSEFQFSEGGAAWGVNMQGVDANDRVTLDEGETALIRVTITPPSQATVGDSARVTVDAESLTADSVESISLEAAITDTTTRDVDVLIVREDPYKVGVDRNTRIDVFLWNRGTATDSIRASFVEDSFDPDEEGIFTASFPQRTFDNVAPGDVARLPIDLTTTDQVESGQELSFGVEAASTEDPDATGQETVVTEVEAVRSFSATGLVGTNDKVTFSQRFGKYNITDMGYASSHARECENPSDWDPSVQYERNCRDFTNHTYHLFELENTGDLTETFEVTEIGGNFDEQPLSGNSCTDILSDRFEGTEFVRSIDHENPGSEEPLGDEVTVAPGETQRFFLRISYDGEDPYWEDVDPRNPLQSQCIYDEYTSNVRVSIQGADVTSLIATETRVYSQHPGEDADGQWHMPDKASANIALQDRVVDNGTVTSLPEFLPVDPEAVSEEDPVTVPFSVSLQSGHYDPARLSILEDAPGWDVEIVPTDAPALEEDDGTLVYPATVPYDAPNPGPEAFHEISGAHLEAQLHIKGLPEDLQEGERETFTIEAESSQDPSVRETLRLGVQIGSEFGFSLDPGVTELTAEQGGEVAFALGVRNTGASVDDYSIEATASPGTYDDPTVRPTSLTIAPGSQKTASVHLDVPAGADAPAAIDVTVRADAGDATQEPILEETVEYTVDVESLGTLELEGPDQEAAIGPGGQAALSFNVTNNGDTREIEMSELVAPSGFDTTLTDGNETITVQAGDTEPFTLLVEAPEDVLEGSVYPFTIRAHDVDDETDFATAVGHAGVTGEVSLNLVAEQEETVIERGSNATLPVRIENPGTAPADYVLSTDFESSGWTSTVRDSDGNALTGGTVEVVERSFERVFVEIRAPDDVPEGHTEAVHVTASALGDQDVSRTVTLNANVHDHAVSIVTEGAQTKDGVPGQNVAYAVTITNEGNGPDRFELSFEGPERAEVPWTTTSVLEDDLTPELEPGERLENVTVIVQTPRAEERPVPVDGEVTVIRATSQADTPGGAPTDTAQVTTNLVRYQSIDVNDDGVLEVAVDLNRDTSDGYEVYHDPTPALIERGELEEDEAERTEGVHALDGDGDDRTEHIVDTSDDGIGDAYFDPDRSQKNTIPYTADMDGDDQPDYPLDSEFDGRLDAVYLAASGDVHAAEEVDLTGDGHFNLLADTDGDTYYDTFVDPQETPPLVTDVARDGDTYKVDTTGDGNVDTHYDAQTQSVSDARAANLGDFLASYWWFVLVFLAVLVAFGLIIYRRV